MPTLGIEKTTFTMHYNLLTSIHFCVMLNIIHPEMRETMEIMTFTPIPDGEHALYISESTSLIIPDCIHKDYIKSKLKGYTSEKNTDKEEIESIAFIVDKERVASAHRNNAQSQASTVGCTEVFGEKIKVEETDLKLSDDLSESYLIEFGIRTKVYTTNPRAFIIALSTLMYLSKNELLRTGEIYDVPASGERGYRIYMPGRASLPDFYNMLDLLVYYKYNMIILEVGGAMEYERHPRINEEWVKFCEDVSRYSGRSDEIQYSQHWKKNSIHYENGDGSYLTKEECREIARRCRECGIEIIPECPTLSHSDYICMAYPEISERQDDPYPDTYCPNHPKTYQIVFDILDEVIEVFSPSRINIGHDEFYTVGICERCKGKDPAAIYANDVKVINEYLKKQGISTIIWAEKLLKARMNYNGYKIGGWYDESDCNGVKFQVPDMFRCADMLPDDVTYLHWYWQFGEHLDDEFHSRGFKVIFGNFSARSCVHFRERIKRGVKGGVVSNWGSLAPEYMQRNMQYLNLITSAYALTSSIFDTPDKDAVTAIAISELHNMYLSQIKHPLKVSHTSHCSIKFKSLWCGYFATDEEYLLGHYKLIYSDGEKRLLPVKYGTNIGPHDKNSATASVMETTYTTIPILQDDGYTYVTEYENPHPGVAIKSIEYIPCLGKEDIKVDYTFNIPDLS